MTKTLFLVAGLLLVVMVAAFVGGLSTGAAGLIMLALLCAGPLFTLTLGLAIGRATFEFTVIRANVRPDSSRAVVHNSRLNRAKEGGSSYAS